MSIKQLNGIARYRHFKGNDYRFLHISKHTETGEKLVCYQALYDDYRFYSIPVQMFYGPVDKKKYPNISQIYRFQELPSIIVGQEWKSKTTNKIYKISSITENNRRIFINIKNVLGNGIVKNMIYGKFVEEYELVRDRIYPISYIL